MNKNDQNSNGDRQPREGSNAVNLRITNDERNLVVSFLQFLRQKLSTGGCSEEQSEGLEVGIQCLEGAFGISDRNYAFQPSKYLLEIFKAVEGVTDGDQLFRTPTEEEIEQANQFKEEGNELVKANKLDDAVKKYNEAIKLNRDPIYFCNRAAAYCRLEQYDLAVQDCRTALALDSKYAKAYGRMGVALSCQNRYNLAVDAYKKALEIDPNNDSYKNNLSIAENKLQQAQEALGGGSQNAPPAGFLGNILNNPDVMRVASQMMQDPNVQNVMGNMMQAFSNIGSGTSQGLEGMLRMGEQMAQQMQQANPDLVDMLRRQFGGGTGGPAGGGDNTNGGGGDDQPPSQDDNRPGPQ